MAHQGALEKRSKDGGLHYSYPEPAVVFRHHVGEVDPLPAPDELPYLGVVVGANVVAHEVAVQAVFPALLLVQENIGGWRGKRSERKR